MKDFIKITKQQAEEYIRAFGIQWVYRLLEQKDFTLGFKDDEIERKLAEVKEEMESLADEIIC